MRHYPPDRSAGGDADMRIVLMVAAACLLAACSQGSSDKSSRDIANLQMLQTQVTSLTGKVDRLESELIKNQAEAKRLESRSLAAAAAMMVGSTAKGEPIQIEFGTIAACDRARKSILDEGLRSCAGHDVGDSTQSTIYGQCSKPQAACFSR